MKRAIQIGVLVLLSVAGSVVVAGAESKKSKDGGLDNAGLVVIDIQEFYFPGGKVPLVGAEEAAAEAAKVLAEFRKKDLPVIHVQHLPDGVDHPDPTGLAGPYRIRPEVMPKPDEILIGKHHANSFRDTELLVFLRQLGVERVVIVGMQTHMCVEAAVRAAADYGFKVTLVHDACATRDLSFGGTTVPAAEVQTAVLAAMQGTYADVVSAAELCGEAK